MMARDLSRFNVPGNDHHVAFDEPGCEKGFSVFGKRKEGNRPKKSCAAISRISLPTGEPRSRWKPRICHRRRRAGGPRPAANEWFQFAPRRHSEEDRHEGPFCWPGWQAGTGFPPRPTAGTTKRQPTESVITWFLPQPGGRLSCRIAQKNFFYF